jgi:hypothetical protein
MPIWEISHVDLALDQTASSGQGGKGAGVTGGGEGTGFRLLHLSSLRRSTDVRLLLE